MDQGMTYAATGVDYDAMDPFKRAAQAAARETTAAAARFGLKEPEWVRGESVYLLEGPDCYYAHQEEDLGTKNVVAEEMYKLTGKSYYDQIAQDTVAMIVNDMITLGAAPVSMTMHLAVGTSEWFLDQQRAGDLATGFAQACALARCVWGGGETATLQDVVSDRHPMLAGSAFGLVKPKSRLIRANLQHGDAIVLLASSGIHANGLTLARRIAAKLPDGYLTPLSDGRRYGEALLDPTVIYVPLVDDALTEGIEIHYAINITGHGWRKLMRAAQPFVYIIEELPPVPPVLGFMQEHGPVDDEEAYGNLNMGAGFALIVPPRDVDRVVSLAGTCGLEALPAGHVEERGDEKRVVIQPKGITFEGATLAVR